MKKMNKKLNMTYFHNMGIMYGEFQVNWHNMKENIGQTIDLDASTNKKWHIETIRNFIHLPQIEICNYSKTQKLLHAKHEGGWGCNKIQILKFQEKWNMQVTHSPAMGVFQISNGSCTYQRSYRALLREILTSRSLVTWRSKPWCNLNLGKKSNLWIEK